MRTYFRGTVSKVQPNLVLVWITFTPSFIKIPPPSNSLSRSFCLTIGAVRVPKFGSAADVTFDVILLTTLVSSNRVVVVYLCHCRGIILLRWNL